MQKQDLKIDRKKHPQTQKVPEMRLARAIPENLEIHKGVKHTMKTNRKQACPHPLQQFFESEAVTRSGLIQTRASPASDWDCTEGQCLGDGFCPCAVVVVARLAILQGRMTYKTCRSWMKFAQPLVKHASGNLSFMVCLLMW